MKTPKLKHIGMRKQGGRNNLGRMTVRHRGGGHKRLYRELEFQSSGHTMEISGKIKRIEYDPNRTAYLAECINRNHRFYKILGGQELKKSMIGQEIKVVKLKEVGVGDEVYKVGIRQGQKGKIGRASGTHCKILKQGDSYTVIRMPSQEVKRINNESQCTLGEVYSKREKRMEKAGAHRRRGIRPTVKGVAMNPIDHPNGGKTAGGGQAKTL